MEKIINIGILKKEFRVFLSKNYPKKPKIDI